MTIEIVKTEKIEDIDRWSCILWITQAGQTWQLAATAPGDLLEAELQGYFEAIEAGLWELANSLQQPVQSDIQAGTGARKWFVDHPNAQLLFQLSIPDLEIEINTLVDALFPTASAANRTRTKLLWTALAVSVRVLAKREFGANGV